MKRAGLTAKQFEELNDRGYTFTSKSYYWIVYEGNIANRITKAEFMSRSIAEPFRSIEQVRVYRRDSRVQD